MFFLYPGQPMFLLYSGQPMFLLYSGQPMFLLYTGQPMFLYIGQQIFFPLTKSTIRQEGYFFKVENLFKLLYSFTTVGQISRKLNIKFVLKAIMCHNIPTKNVYRMLSCVIIRMRHFSTVLQSRVSVIIAYFTSIL